MKILITGDSHTAALQRGKQELEQAGKWPEGLELVVRPLGGGHLLPTPFFVDRGSYAEIVAADYRRQYLRLPLEDEPGSERIYGLCAPLHSARIWRQSDWQNYAPLGVAQQEAPISSGLLRAAVLEDQKFVLQLIDVFVRTGKRIFVIEPPLPFAHHDAFRKIRKETIIAVDHTYRQLMRKELADRKVPIVSVPDRCRDLEGMMRKEYGRMGDQHHGNRMFGRVMMMEIIEFLRSEDLLAQGPAGAQLREARGRSMPGTSGAVSLTEATE